MRRITLFVMFAAAGVLLPTALFAQTGGPDLPAFLAGPQPWMPQGSELGRNSFGVFTNPLDSALNLFQVQAGSGFRTLTSAYAFGGVDNLYGAAAVQGATLGQFYGGFFTPGALPWSVYAYLNHTGVAGEPASSTAYTPASYTIGNTTYNWIQQQTDVKNSTRPLASVNNDFVQGLVGIGPFTTGLGVKLNLVDNWWGANNSTTVLTQNYNTTPGGAPTQTLDYTLTTVKTDARGAGASQSTSDVAFGVPLLFNLGGLSQSRPSASKRPEQTRRTAS